MINLSLFYHHSAEIYHQRREISLTACISWNPAFLFGPAPCVICCQHHRNQRISKSSENLPMFRRNRPISLRHVGMPAKPVRLSRVGVVCFSRYGVKWLGESLNPIFRTFSQGGGGIFRFTFQGMTAKLPRMPVYRNKSVCQHFS